MIAEEKLVVVISQPRSGTTLLQHLLGSHSKIHTVPEPWLLLPVCEILTDRLGNARYNKKYANQAINDLCDRTPGVRETLIDGLRNVALSTYGTAMRGTGKEWFLDKTTRYFHVIPELQQIFPNAMFVLLRRNPLAVISSICHSNYHGNWREMFSRPDRGFDVLEGPVTLANELTAPVLRREVQIRYEDIVRHPAETLATVCETIGIEFEPDMIEYGGKVCFSKTTWVDPKSIYQFDRPVTNFVDGWKESVRTNQDKEILRGYLGFLGSRVIRSLGYDFDELNEQVAQLSPPRRYWRARRWDRYLGITNQVAELQRNRGLQK